MKNRMAFVELRQCSWTSNDRIKVIQSLTPANYFRGPTKDEQNTPNQGDLWEFGIYIRPKPKLKKEVDD